MARKPVTLLKPQTKKMLKKKGATTASVAKELGVDAGHIYSFIASKKDKHVVKFRIPAKKLKAKAKAKTKAKKNGAPDIVAHYEDEVAITTGRLPLYPETLAEFKKTIKDLDLNQLEVAHAISSVLTRTMKAMRDPKLALLHQHDDIAREYGLMAMREARAEA